MRIETPMSKKQEIYSDFTKDLYLNPVSFDIIRKTNEDSIKESIKNLIMTNKGERLFQPSLGCDIRRLLFENFMPATVKIAEENIKETIRKFEPRAELLDVSVIGYPDENSVQINISFATIMAEDPVSFSILVDRIR